VSYIKTKREEDTLHWTETESFAGHTCWCTCNYNF